MGRRRARGGHDELFAGRWLPRRVCDHAPGRPLHPCRKRHAALRVQGRRSGDLDRQRERVDSDEPDRRADLRICLPREQLRARRRAERRALRGPAESENAEMRIVGVAILAMLSAVQAPAPPPAPATYMSEQALMATLKEAEKTAPAMHTAPVKL